MGYSPWIMWKKERIVIVEYIDKFVCKGRNRKRRIKRVRTSRLIQVVRPYSIEEVGEYPLSKTTQGIDNDQEKQGGKASRRIVWVD